MEEEKRRPPIETFRLGQIKATVWANRNQNRTYYSVNITRSYTDQNGRWQETGSLMVHHIPLVQEVLEHAYACIYELQRQGGNGDEYVDPVACGAVPFDGADDASAAYAQ